MLTCRAFPILLSCLAMVLPAASHAVQERLIDRLVAVVDDDPIFLSDIERAIALGLVEREAGESTEALRRRVLDDLIDQRLRLHEVARYDVGPVPGEEVERQLAGIRQRFTSEDELSSHLVAVGLDLDGLRHLLTQQLRILIYVEERLGPRVFVDLDDIRAYYENELRPAMAAQGQEPPPIVEVREDIRAVLRELELDKAIQSWTEDLRQKADITDHLRQRERSLPPVMRRLESPKDSESDRPR